MPTVVREYFSTPQWLSPIFYGHHLLSGRRNHGLGIIRHKSRAIDFGDSDDLAHGVFAVAEN